MSSIQIGLTGIRGIFLDISHSVQYETYIKVSAHITLLLCVELQMNVRYVIQRVAKSCEKI